MMNILNYRNTIKSANKFFTKFNMTSVNFGKYFSTEVQTPKRSHGGLKDSDRIFTNIYRDTDPFIEGALKRVF